MSRLNDLLRQLRLKDPALADDLQREVDALADRRSFGLNFERHVPEAVELPGRRVCRGDKVRILPPRGTTPTKADQRLWRVLGVSSAEASFEALDGNDPRDAARMSVDDLVVVAEFRDPIYPGLVSTAKIERGGDKPFHTVINAENYHALQSLLFTHRGEVDCIYIDPPYNTGNEGWIYSDRYIAAEDLHRHSKWLAFIERRLLLARDLLAPTGVILVAIGEEEHPRLRLLLEQTFGESNFIAELVWQGGRKNDSRFVSASSDYMIVFAKSLGELIASDVRWTEPKSGVETLQAAGLDAWERSGHDAASATALLRKWWSSLPDGHPAKADRGLRLYDRVDDVKPGEVFASDNLRSPNPRPNLQYDVPHPRTGLPVKRHPNGWVYSRSTMETRMAQGLILFGADHTTTARFKRYLSASSAQTPMPCFTADRAAGSDHLLELLGEKRFPNPKDHLVLMRWLRIVAGSDAVVVDFFAGSGTTGEAVMRLNEEDGGRRRCILVTNNEVAASDAKKLRKDGYRPGDQEWEARGVHDYVTKPRLSTLGTSERPDGSTYPNAVKQNIEFFTLTYEAPLRVGSQREFERIAPLLWLRAGSVGRRIDDVAKGWDVADAYGVLADLDHVDTFLHALKEQKTATTAFVVTDEDRLFESVCRDLPEHVEPIRLYESYLRNFEIEAGRGSR